MIIKITPINDPGGYGEGLSSKDIYLKKDGEIIGLHAYGEKDSEWTVQNLDGTRETVKGFNQYEQWGNYYDENHKMVGRGSFRIFGDIEEVAEDLEKDGWISYEGPTRKDLSNG